MGRSLRRFLKALSLSLSLVWTAKSACAYPVPVDFDGSLMRWNIGPDAPPITYAISADSAQDESLYSGAVDDAAQLWSHIPTSYFAYQHATDAKAAQVTIYLDSALSGARDSAGFAIFDQYSGKHPLHCSIHVLVDQQVAYTDMAKTFLHEFGHCLGLGHTLVPQAIMSYVLDKNSFALDTDDEAAATRLYPADGSSPKLPPGCAAGSALGGTRVDADQAPQRLWLLSLLLLMPVVVIAVLQPIASMRSIDRFARKRTSSGTKTS